MKKQLHLIVLLIACISISSVSFALPTWDAPVLKSSVLTSGTAYYVCNVGLEGFLNRGGEHGTHAVVTSTPYPSQSNSLLKWVATNITGSEWKFQYSLDNKYLFSAINNNDGSVFTDGGDPNWYPIWVVDLVDPTNKYYTLQIPSTYTGYDASKFLGVNPTVQSTNKGLANMVKYDRLTGDDYTKWFFVSQADYDLYLAKQKLSRYMTYANMIGIVLTDYISTYESDVTADILAAADELLDELNPINVSHYITNPSFESNLDGWTNNGFKTHDSGALGSYKDGNRFCEQWTNHGSNLGVISITQALTGLPNGIYGLVLAAHAYQEAGSNPRHTNAFVTAGSSSTEVSVRKDYFVDFLEVTDGTLTIGYKTEGQVACNWTAFDNFRLYLYHTTSSDFVHLDVSESSLLFSDENEVKTFKVTGLNLTDNVTLSAPAGITLNPTSITPAEAADGKTVTVTVNPSTDKLEGQITVSTATTGIDNKTVNVTAFKNAYCANFLAPAKNIMVDPYFNNNPQPGWGGSANISENAYCGAYAGRVLGNWQNCIDKPTTIPWKPETAYLLRVYVNTTGSGTLIEYGNTWIGGNRNSRGYVPNTGGEWELHEATFVTGNTTDNGRLSLATDDGGAYSYFDNFELYEAWIVSFNTGAGSAVAPKYVIKGEKLGTVTEPTLEGYTFKGWFKEESCTNAWNFETDVVDSNKTLYAKWDFNVGMNLPGDAVIRTEYFSLTGAQLESIDQSGLYIVKKIYESGKTEVLKQFIKHAN
jgi:uncharacterized repeat protein (TIGR02543 family)